MKKKKKSKVLVSFEVDKGLLKDIDKMAKTENRSRSAQVRKFCQDGVVRD